MTGIYAAFDRDRANQPIDDPPCCIPCPEQGDCDPAECAAFAAYCEAREWTLSDWGDKLDATKYALENIDAID